MKPDERAVSDEFLNAYVDGELTEAEKARAIERLSGDAGLKRQVCELRLLKDMVRTGYRQVPGAAGPGDSGRAHPRAAQALAACCLLVAGLSLGWLGRGMIAPEAQVLRTAWLEGVVAHPGKVMLHVDGAAAARFRQVLDGTEQVLKEARHGGRDVQVELVANSQGLDLFRVATSPHAQRIRELQARYPNLLLVGCGQTVRKLQERGQDARLLPGVHVAPTALDEIVDKLQTGWVYVKV